MAEIARLPVTGKMGTFSIIWSGQTASLIGSGLSTYALGIWLFQQTGSITLYTLVTLCGLLAGFIMFPIVGILVDRYDRRMIMIYGNISAALSTGGLLLLLMTHHFSYWNIYPITICTSASTAFLQPTLSASIALLVPKERLGRANGLVQLSMAIAQLSAPLLAGVLIANMKLQGIVMIDLTSFLFAFMTILMVRIPAHKQLQRETVKKPSLSQEIRFGWHYLRGRTGLLILMIFTAITYFLTAIVGALATPLVLSFTTAAVLGTMASISGCGMFLGAIIMSIWGGPRHRVYGMFAFLLLCGVCLMLAGSQPNIFLITPAAFGILFSIPLINGSIRTIMQRKVAPEVQGRVFSLEQLLTGLTTPLGYLIAGPLADRVFDPLLLPGGALASSIGGVIGVGKGRGIGLLFIIVGAFLILCTIGGYFHPRLRLLERELPDALPDV
ncbi:MAG TPA: MFS transporter [Ktedonobacteraceae bacterium]|jgi:DHA3 family macrolide efflux protein-like MFS transporter|nr:MFS transporter [Ktedonobacteraceae bacterium]